jgi:hypothetical protein
MIKSKYGKGISQMKEIFTLDLKYLIFNNKI